MQAPVLHDRIARSRADVLTASENLSGSEKGHDNSKVSLQHLDKKYDRSPNTSELHLGKKIRGWPRKKSKNNEGQKGLNHEMNGPTLTMAPAAVEASAPFLRSQSSPDLLSGLSKSTKPKLQRELADATEDGGLSSGLDLTSQQPQQPQRAFSLKTVPSLPAPSLPAFDVPSFDLSTDFETSFQLESPVETLRPGKVELAIQPSLSPAAAVATETDTLEIPLRKRSKVERRHSWLVTSKSALSLREYVEERKKPKAEKEAPPAVLVKQPKSLPRSKTVESFADFAKRSWRSRSPSPSSKREPSPRGPDKTESSPDRSTRSSSPFRRRTGLVGRKFGSSSNLKGPVVSIPDNTRTAAAESESPFPSPSTPSSKSRALNRASVYLTRITQKPHFSKSSSSLPSAVVYNASSSSKDGPDAASTAPTPGATTSNSAAGNAPAQPGSEQGSSSLSVNLNNLVPNPRNSSHTASSAASSTTGTAASENASQATTDTGVSVSMPHPTSRDPLWATFRTLDVDFAKFANKSSTSGRMSIVRSTLVPFLRDTAYHPSHGRRNQLSPEDIDRRATILNKWWNGLLEMLEGGNSRHTIASQSMLGTNGSTTLAANLQPVAGVDRPTLFQVTTMIMMRPEWRMCTRDFQALADRRPDERVRGRSWTGSTGDSDKESTGSNFLAESAEHNVRTMFQTNLLTQMAIVVDKMSQRHAPLSLVNWCGKACAYAFFFAPGIADVLVRLWVLNGDLLRRVADQFDLPRRGSGQSEDMVAMFPRNISELGWTSVKAMGNKLRLPAKLPLMPAKVPWHGPWVTRWRGGDTDLFFLFCKYYFVLAEEFLPTGLPLVDKARAPAFVLVQAQILATLDTTIHRQASLEAALLGPPLSDALHGADAALLTPITVPSNLLRDMDENRLVILLRDMVAEQSAISPEAKHTFAQAFMGIMKAATKRTSQFAHGAHFVLCDFLEEALSALQAYQNDVNHSVAALPVPIPDTAPRLGPLFSASGSSGLGGSNQSVDHIDWPFWFDVGKMILNSNSTMSEIRILSFLYAIWDTIAADARRKEMVCVGWLLREDVFEKFFNHWCPMVRAYYMRLLCWRICRDSGNATDLDTDIFLLVSQRLKTVWAHYLWLKQTADEKRREPPSTAPCQPTPGKRFMIVKTEVPPPQPGILLGFDPVSSSFPRREMLANANAAAAAAEAAAVAALDAENSAAANSRAEAAQSSYKKRWSLLGKVLSFTAPQANVAAGVGANSGLGRNWDNDLDQARRETATTRSSVHNGTGNNKTFSGILSQMPGPPPPPAKMKQTHGNGTYDLKQSSESISSTGSSPVYDVAQIVFRFTLAAQAPTGPLAIRDRILTSPRLPTPAQTRIGSHTTDGPGPRPETRGHKGVMPTGLVSEARTVRLLESDRAVQEKEIMVVAAAVTNATTRTTDVTKTEKRLSVGMTIRAVPEDSDSDESNATGDSDDDEGNHVSGSEPKPSLPLNLDESGLSLGVGTGFSFDFDSELSRQQEPKLGQPPEGLLQPAAVTTTPGGSAQVQPVQPVGIFARGAPYTGRALAEWGMVVNECNNFVDRRREEGVVELGCVEVPTLGVEGMGMRQRG